MSIIKFENAADAFNRLHEEGIQVIPIYRKDQPAFEWKAYQRRFATQGEIRFWAGIYASLAILCGLISFGLEVLDFDCLRTAKDFLLKVRGDLINRLPIIQTPGGGTHIYYRCSVIAPSTKIALDQAGRVRVETRGEGGYAVSSGSALDVHELGKPYEIIQWQDFPKVPMIEPAERWELIMLARSYHVPQRGDVEAAKKLLMRKFQSPSVARPDRRVSQTSEELSARNRDLLAKTGWTTSDEISYTRPGKDSGLSAKFNKALDGNEVFTVFSTNAGELSPDAGHRSWSMRELFQRLSEPDAQIV